MTAFWRFLSAAAVFAVLSGGCPLETGTGPGSSTGGISSGGTTGVSSGGTSGGSTTGLGSSVDALAAQFPGCSEAPNGQAWRDEILRLVNVERTRVGLEPLVRNEALEDQATQYACELIHYDFFAHDNPYTGTDVRARAEDFGVVLGVNYAAIGENLAAGQSTPSQAMADWMNSEGHRANILSREFTEIGVGIRTGGSYGTYWVQEFGRPLGG